HFQRLRVLLVLALPDELRVERTVAVDDELLRPVVSRKRGGFACGNVRSRVRDVLVRINRNARGRFGLLALRHRGTFRAWAEQLAVWVTLVESAGRRVEPESRRRSTRGFAAVR